jgi:DNA-binding IclR family transcriptional regulator
MTLAEELDNGRETDYMVPALQRGLSILQMFNARERTLGTSEIAERLGVSASAIYRILHTLCEMGYLRKIAKNTYELGPQVVSDGFSYLASRDLVDLALPHLNALRDRTSLSCHLTIREQTDSLYLCRAFAAQRLSVNIPVGTRLPCHCTAMGRILLTGLTPPVLDALYSHVRLDGYAPPAPRTLPELQELIAGDRARLGAAPLRLLHRHRHRHPQPPRRSRRRHQPVRSGRGNGQRGVAGAFSRGAAAHRGADFRGAGRLKGGACHTAGL